MNTPTQEELSFRNCMACGQEESMQHPVVLKFVNDSEYRILRCVDAEACMARWEVETAIDIDRARNG